MKSSSTILLLLVAGLGYVLFFGGRGTAFGPVGLGITALLFLPDRKEVYDALGDAADAHGLPRQWLQAIGFVESRFRRGATNLTGPDGARGGAWGATQITEKTARAYGYTGPMDALLDDIYFMADLSARILAAGHPQSIEDAGAWWNAGRSTAAALPPGHITLVTYIPRLEAALAEV